MESECSIGRKSRRRGISQTLSPRDRGELRLSSSHTLALVSALEIASAGLFVIIRSNLEKSAARQAVNPRNFFSELKRRNVYKVAIAYGVVAWLLLQAASILFPTFEAPTWTMKVFVAMTALGFPIALIIAWAFELTPEGLKRTEFADELPKKPSRNRAWIYVVVIAGAISCGLFFLGRFTASTKQSGSADISAKSIAVLPFENLSDEKQNAYFADGVQDEILMGVSHLVEGSVQRSVNRVRVNAQLIDARTDAHLWAQTYDRDLADVFAIQSEIAKTIADQLQAKILPREKVAIEKQPTKDVTAYGLYILATEAIDGAANSQNGKENCLQGVSSLEQAIARDPAFLAAYCKLAQAHDELYLYGFDHTPARLVFAEQAINAALRLQPDAAEAHLALAHHRYSKLDYDGAREEIEIARRTLPNDPRTFEWSGYIDRRQGRWQESTRNLERALELDPNNIFVLQQISQSYDMLREYAREAAALERVLAIRPNDLDTRVNRAQVEVFWKADTQPLHELIESFMRQNPASGTRLAPVRILLASAERDPTAGLRAVVDLGENTYGPDAIRYTRAFGEGFFAWMKGDTVAGQTGFTKARAEQQQIVNAQPDYGPALCVLGLIDAGLGRKDDALREGRRAAELMPPSKDSINGALIMRQLAVIYAWVGEKELAIDQLERSAQVPGSLTYGQLRLWPHWDLLRGDPRFENIVASLAPKDGDK